MIVLSAGGVTVVVDVDGGLPAIVHWGPDLAGTAPAALRDARRPVPGTNAPDRPLRLALLPEPHDGWTGRPGVLGSRAGRGWAPRFTPRRVLLDGIEVTEAVTGAGRLDVESRDDDAALGLDVVVELLAGGLLRCRATLTNLADEPYELGGLLLALPVPAEAAELLDFAGRHEHERVPQRRAFTVGTHLRENRRGRTGADSAFLLHAGTPGFGFARGEVFAVHTAWSGNHVHLAEQAASGERVLGGGELLLPGEIRLGRGEAYTSPWLYGSCGTGLDELAARFHRHLRTGRPRPVTLNVWEAVWFDHDPARLVDLAERAAALGVERFVLDDGWFGARRDDRAGLGDWTVSPEVWPDGLHPLVDRVRSLGMEFGLWVEPEMVNPDSDLARVHPEWIMAARSELPPESRFQQVLDLDRAYVHIRDALFALLAEYDIGYLKWDHNRDLVEAGGTGGRPGVHAQTLALYRLLDELRAAHPGLGIESCSSGGARVDLGILERTDRVWVSDQLDPHERQRMLRWTAQLLPPEYLGSHIGAARSHSTGRVHDLGFRAATAVFGHLGIEQDLAAVPEAELAGLQEWIAWWKANRELLLGGDLVRMDVAGDDLLVHGVVAPDRSRALIALVRTATSATAHTPPLRFRGLDPERSYRVRPLVIGDAPAGLPGWAAEGVVVTGAALEHAGLASPVLHPDQALLLEVSEIDSRQNR
ncbi:alpha-galactosidase [Pseudonocardia ailaonensis]|uniref:alpha-galactosidase n=1 Tax=Pseudonocardia ailaonensis TaxID=367279 RepID=A0ABN2MYJ6_9PSEU